MTEEKIETAQEEVPELMPDPINFTDAAVAKVKELMDEEGNPNLKLRVFVQGGGCAGFQYGFTFVHLLFSQPFLLSLQNASTPGQSVLHL